MKKLMVAGMTFLLAGGLATNVAAEKTWELMEVSEDKKFTVVFSEVMDMDSVKENVGVYHQGEKVSVDVIYKGDSVEILPTSYWESDERYTIEIDKELASEEGESLEEDVNVPFIVEGTGKVEIVDSIYGEDWSLSGIDSGEMYLWNEEDGEESGFYVWREGESRVGIEVGYSREQVSSILGEAETSFDRGNGRYQITESYFDVYEVEGKEVTVFYDKHERDQVRAIYGVDKEETESLEGFYVGDANWDEESQTGIMLALMNKDRQKRGLEPLDWNEELVPVADSHSRDMIDNDYFGHVNPDGEQVSDRVENAGLTMSWVGENLAYGQVNSIYAHEGLMDSKGHRDNILKEEFKEVGIGIERDENNIPYYTIVFYTGR